MSDERMVITRKYTLIPVESERKEWRKKVVDYLSSDYKEKIDFFTKKLESAKKADKIAYQAKLEKYQNLLSDVQKEDCVFTQKIVNDYTYGLVKEAMDSEARRKNYILSWIFSEMIANDVQHMEFKDRITFISEHLNYGYRIKGNKNGSLFDNTEIENILGGYGSVFSQELTGKVKDAVKNGLLEGKCSLENYKLDSPFTIAKTHMSFSHDYESFEELCEHITDSDCKLYFNYGNKKPTIAKFRINLGHGKNREELISTLLRVYSGEYQYCGSSIQIFNNKIILNLSMSIPIQSIELDENTVVGVDMGIAVPAMCALNNNLYERLAIGDANDFLRKRTQLQAERKRLQKSLKMTKGGHGRTKKLQALARLQKCEDNFVNTYCHQVSRAVVDFAVKHHAKYINIENLTGYDTSDFILRNWSYYKLQQYITYKAAEYDIIVRKINPCYTSQVCSICGHWEPGQRKSQAVFECADVSCSSHVKYKNGFNADFNAARNIAKSTLFMESGQVTEKSKEEARGYYGITEECKKGLEELDSLVA